MTCLDPCVLSPPTTFNQNSSAKSRLSLTLQKETERISIHPTQPPPATLLILYPITVNRFDLRLNNILYLFYTLQWPHGNCLIPFYRPQLTDGIARNFVLFFLRRTWAIDFERLELHHTLHWRSDWLFGHHRAIRADTRKARARAQKPSSHITLQQLVTNTNQHLLFAEDSSRKLSDRPGLIIPPPPLSPFLHSIFCHQVRTFIQLSTVSIDLILWWAYYIIPIETCMKLFYVP